MISNAIVLWALIACTVLLATAAAIPVALPPLTRAWQKATAPGRSVFFIAVLCAMLYAGTKTNQVNQTSGTNEVGIASVGGPHKVEAASSPLVLNGNFRFPTSDEDVASPLPVTPEDIARGWQRLGPFTNDTLVYTMPDGATLATNWWLRGAFEDVTRISNLWAFTWGKVRFALSDTNEIVAVGAPMSAIPYRSRLWSAEDTNGSFRITWENFVMGRTEESFLCASGETPLPLCSAQIELRANGDYVTRSNEVETVWRRIDPDDFDDDGYLNGDDPNPLEWDDGADTYYGPCNELPWGCNEDAYCDVTVMIGGTQGEWVAFEGDGESDYDDPYFYAKPGVPYDVKVLIGKTYRVTCDAPVRAVGKSDDEIDVSDVSSNAFTVVWPVTITEAPRLFAAPLPGLLGGSHGNTGFTLTVDPPWLDGVFGWATNSCCHVIGNDNWWRFACEDDCKCGGCEIGGSYTYEGYSVFFSDISCGCHYTPHSGTRWGIAAPPVVFKDGALRPLEITFHHGSSADPEEGELELLTVFGNDKVRLWEDAEMTREAQTFTWDASTFSGCTYYVEAIDTSDLVDDVRFKLVWSRPGGSSDERTTSTTCAEVFRTEVAVTAGDIVDGSPNQQPFEGHMSWEFNVTNSPYPDKHFSVLFRDVADDNFTVRDFSVQMTLVVQPTDAPVGTASWFPLEPTPSSGTIVGTAARTGELRNPKVGGVYHIGSCFDGSPTNECNIVLPLAGASVDAILQADLARADAFAVAARAKYSIKTINSFEFGVYWFWCDGNGDYVGRPDASATPTVWYYNQVDDAGLGAVTTLSGVPIRLAKVSNLVAAYACEKLGVYQELQELAQWIGTRNDVAAQISWQCGTDLAHGSNFVHSVSNMVRQAWLGRDQKTIRLWPNPTPAENWSSILDYSDMDRRLYSPGMLYQTP